MLLHKGKIMISNKILFQRGFNDLFFKFMDDIIQMFSNDNEFIIAKTTFETLKRANPSSLVKAWYKYITLPFITENSDLTFLEDASTDPTKLKVLLFLKSYETNINKNSIPELNGFFIKLKTELDKIILHLPLHDTTNESSSTILSDESFKSDNESVNIFNRGITGAKNESFGMQCRKIEKQPYEYNLEKLLVVDNYFNKLNKLSISYS